MFRRTTVAAVVVFAFVATSRATPLVSAEFIFDRGLRGIDFFYTATPGAEFTAYRLAVTTTNGNGIQDPLKFATSDQDGDAIDTWMNTVYSLYGLGPASYLFNAYKPIGLGANTPPVSSIDWHVFDTGTGDINQFNIGAPYGTVSAPFHLARVLLTPGSVGFWSFQAFDTKTAAGVTFTGFFEPEPTSASLIMPGLFGVLGFTRRRVTPTLGPR